MNTKQLWIALTLNPKSNFYFDGIFSIDTLKDIKEKPSLIICNTDPSDEPGKHWVLYFFNEDSVDFYDSLVRDITYYGSEFIDFIKNFTSNFEQYLRRTQPIKSDLCGQYCLYYAFAKCNGLSMEKIINNMLSKDDDVKFVNKMFFICDSSQCPLLQYCNLC